MPRKTPLSPSIIVVQEIAVEWSKQSRGGNGAALRNSVPEVTALPLSAAPILKGATVLGHRRVYQEKAGFAAPASEELTVDPALPVKPQKNHYPKSCVFVARTAEGISVEFEYHWFRCGSPNREWSRKTLMLTLNQWGQIAYNGRFASMSSDWRYEKHVFNVGLFDASAVESDVFLRSKPTERFSAMALLI